MRNFDPTPGVTLYRRSKLASTDITSEALCDESGGIEVRALPTTVFFDSKGKRRATLVGSQPIATLDAVARAVEAL